VFLRRSPNENISTKKYVLNGRVACGVL
jgi:hypothetical protein